MWAANPNAAVLSSPSSDKKHEEAMTQIRGQFVASRRPGELGVHSVDSFHLVVPELQQAKDFYSAFGLDVKTVGNRLDMYTHGSSHRWGTIGEALRKELSYLSFGVFEADFPSFKIRLQSVGVPQVDAPAGSESNGMWFRNPDGLLIELKVAEKTSPNVKSSFDTTSSAPGVPGSDLRSETRPVYPRRLAHTVIFTADVSASVRFYSGVLGLRLSDRSGDEIAFMHGIHGSDHHMIAVAKSNGPGLHHLSWDVGSVHEIGLGAKLMADKGFEKGWGLGRHALGSNYFHYVRDPWGSYAEYSCDIDFIPANFDWEAGDHPADESLYVWGPSPPRDFVFNYERGV
jgi:catechol 2,3-dioxygenase-like lactoylglutathione lyase family enzyme